MKKRSISEVQIVKALKEHESAKDLLKKNPTKTCLIGFYDGLFHHPAIIQIPGDPRSLF